MLRLGHVMPGDLDLPDFTLREFAAFERYVSEVEQRERLQAEFAKAAIASGQQP